MFKPKFLVNIIHKLDKTLSNLTECKTVVQHRARYRRKKQNEGSSSVGVKMTNLAH